MIALQISLNGVHCGDHEIVAERTVIGRRAECEIQLLDPAVSGQHALVTLVMDEPWVEDLGSTNGTYVNGQLTRKRLLEDGDEIGIGQHRLHCLVNTMTALNERLDADLADGAAGFSFAREIDQVALDDQQRAVLSSFEQTVRHKPGELLPPLAPPPLAWLRLRAGPHAGRKLKLDRPRFSLGAGRQQVAVIARQASGYVLVPAAKQSYAGDAPRVNGELADAAGQSLYHQDVIEIGGVEVEFLFDR